MVAGSGTSWLRTGRDGLAAVPGLIRPRRKRGSDRSEYCSLTIQEKPKEGFEKHHQPERQQKKPSQDNPQGRRAFLVHRYHHPHDGESSER